MVVDGSNHIITRNTEEIRDAIMTAVPGLHQEPGNGVLSS